MEGPDFRAGFRGDSVIYRIHGSQIVARFVDSNPTVRVDGTTPQAGKLNFILGNKNNNWTRDVPTYAGIVYHNLYPGIDLRYAMEKAQLKSEYLVKPGSDVKLIRTEYPDADRVVVNDDGELVVTASGTELREAAPEVYQDSATARVRIQGGYRLIGRRTVAFEIGDYDSSRALMIDPPITYCTYLGGDSLTNVTGVAVDNVGGLYITGWTESLTFPIALPFQGSNGGGVDAFVAKLNRTGSTLLYGTFIGGASDDRAAAIAVDSAGQAYVTGSTSSTNFPLANPVRSRLGGGRDAFAFKLSSAGNQMIYSTYLGGSGWDQGTAIAADSTGNAYLAGDTQSTDFPVLNAVQPTFGGQTDAFVTKLTASGQIALSSFLGGSNNEHAGGVAIDAARNIYVAGGTYSQNFPTFNPFQGIIGGGEDAFVTKISATGSSFVYSTYAGGSGAIEQANAVAVDVNGNAYAAGNTLSANFPVSQGALRTTYNGTQDAFLIKFDASGGLVYGTYLGGSQSNLANSVAVNTSGSAVVVGSTSSSDFPTAGALQSSLNGGSDAFIAEVNASGTALSFSSFYGGSGLDAANAVAVDTAGNIYVGGQTNSSDLPLVNAFDSIYPAISTGWVLRLGQAIPPSFSSAAPDFDHNGVPDLIWQNDATRQATVWHMGGAQGTTLLSWNYLVTTSVPGWHIVGAADFDGNGHPDLIWLNDTSRQATVWYMGGTEGNTFLGWNYLTSAGAPGWTLVAAADFNNDGTPDLVWQNDTTRQLTVWYMGGVQGSTLVSWNYLSPSPNPGWHVAAIADFNIDGHPDLLWQNDATGQLTISFLGGGQGITPLTSSAVSGGAMTGWSVVGAGDFNGDGQPDLIWQNTSTRQVQVWYMGGPLGATELSWAWLNQSGEPGWTLR